MFLVDKEMLLLTSVILTMPVYVLNVVWNNDHGLAKGLISLHTFPLTDLSICAWYDERRLYEHFCLGKTASVLEWLWTICLMIFLVEEMHPYITF
jgi:hypothetical protein